MPTPPVLLDPEFAPVWRAVSRHLDRHGLEARGRVTVPAGLAGPVQVALGTLLNEPARPDRRTFDLAVLEVGLQHRGLTLTGILDEVGIVPAGRKDRRDAQAARLQDRDETLDVAAARDLGDAPWVGSWVAQVRQTLADADSARRAVTTVTRVLRAADERRDRSRGEVAAVELGGAHRLDSGTASRRWVGKALALRTDTVDGGRWDDPELWDQAGLPSDLVSVPVLTWALPLVADRRVGDVGAAVRAATSAGMPAPLTMLTLRDLVVDVPPGTVVTSVENPRLLEAAVQQRHREPMVCTSGNPRRAVVHLVRALVSAGAEVRHHGDFDPAGVRITASLAGLGVVPWRMTAADYRAAVAAAEGDDVELPPITGDVPATPWDPELANAMTELGLAVEEERVMDALLAELAGSG